MSELVWMVSRSTGLGSMVLLSASGVTGMLTARTGGGSAVRDVARGVREAVRLGVHRSLSLVGVVFLATHVLTAVLDKSFTNVSAWAVFVPLASRYETIGVTLGTVAADALILVMVTSILRPRLPESWWKPVHNLTYACLLLALVHGLVMREPGDVITPVVLTGCVLALATALAVRLARPSSDRLLRTALGRTQWR